jgi:hypothetical protein
MQELCIEVLHQIAPLRAEKFLQEAATATSLPASVRRSASIALGEIRHPQAAQRLATALRDPAVDRTYLDWAFSTLSAVSVDWSGASDYIDEVLGQGDEPSRQLRYSLALRGDDPRMPELIDQLNDSEPYNRWTAALTLVRILGPESRRYLDGRAEVARDNLERCAMYAALVRAGEFDKVGSLHEALQATDRIPQLSSVWKLEILDALRTAGTFDARAFSLWRMEARVSWRQLQYFDALSPRSFDKPGPKFSSSLSTSKPPPTKVFLSYSRQDAKWLKRFQVMLRPLIRNERVDLWDDTKMQPGKWRDQIQTAMSEANVALFLVSANFLASEFIMSHELPDLLRFAEDRHVTILWVLVVVLQTCCQTS